MVCEYYIKLTEGKRENNIRIIFDNAIMIHPTEGNRIIITPGIPL